MEIILYLSAALAAIAFLILVIYLASTLKALRATLDSVSDTLKGLENQLEGVTSETALLLQKTNALADDLQQKSERLNTVVDAVKDVGTTVTRFNGTLQNITQTIDKQVEANKEKVSQIVQWSNVFLELKDKWQERRQAQKEQTVKEPLRVRSH
ncbi:DUF948 domain-containing protein [Neobacillus dielmonensis]|uniref:DUF948 domain-containing protein n=1 Tax=Neobacillus dielmonensis TaxID=1347369 RepID=UPI0005AA386A|nr:DUF948 domain-containing protein [Neobacillus dielmonensis]